MLVFLCLEDDVIDPKAKPSDSDDVIVIDECDEESEEEEEYGEKL